MLARRAAFVGLGLAAGVVVGVIALAYTSANEAALPAALIVILSPGLRVAELLVPGSHESLGWTFGWFLRIAIATNGLYYFILFALAAFFAARAVRKAAKR
jgi:hypothetical protein